MAEYLSEEDMSTGEYISRDVALRQLNATCSATDCNNYNGVMCRADVFITPSMCYEMQKKGVKPKQKKAAVECEEFEDGEYFELNFKYYGPIDYVLILNCLIRAYTEYAANQLECEK